MNERIKELAEQCHWETYGVNGELLESGFDAEKFAELIVQECISYIDSRDYHSGSEGIAEHFGVEE